MKNIEHEIDIEIIKSENTNFAGTEVGVQVTHIETGLTASSTSNSSQYLNKLEALELLREKLTTFSP
ncbi:hypothetical protein KUL118_23940 [Tenacibaculum sp. KUL118]|nr:hypothetical protein KUL118_23940 [Tenacibaculum sp. KUL118]